MIKLFGYLDINLEELTQEEDEYEYRAPRQYLSAPLKEKDVTKALKELQKQLTSSRSLETTAAYLGNFIGKFKLYVCSQDTSKQFLPKNTKKNIEDVFNILKRLAKKFNGKFVTAAFIFEFVQIIQIITSFGEDSDLISIAWKCTFWLITLNCPKIKINSWQEILYSFFNPGQDDAVEYLIFVNKKIPEISPQSVIQWWKIFVRSFLPYYMYFPIIKNAPAQRTQQKRPVKGFLARIFPFVENIVSYRPKVPILTDEDMDSAFAITAFIQLVIYESEFQYESFITSACNNFFDIYFDTSQLEENGPYAFSKCKAIISAEAQNNLTSVLESLYSQGFEYASALIICLIRDIELNSHSIETCALTIFRFRVVLQSLLLIDITPDEIMIICSSFFLVATHQKCAQIYRLYSEFSLMLREVPPNFWKFISNSSEISDAIRPILERFASQVIFAGAETIFGISLKSFSGEIDPNPLSLEAAIMGAPKILQPYFAPMQPPGMSYAAFKRYIEGLLDVYPRKGEVPLLRSISLAISAIAKRAPQSDTSNLIEFATSLVRLFDGRFLTEPGLHCSEIFLLLEFAKNLNEIEKEKWVKVFNENARSGKCVDECISLSRNPTFASYSLDITMAVADGVSNNPELVNSERRVNFLLDAMALGFDQDKLINILSNCFQKAAPIMTFCLALVILFSIAPSDRFKNLNSDDNLLSLFQKVLNCICESEAISLFSPIFSLHPTIAGDITYQGQISCVAHASMNNLIMFGRAITVLQDAAVFSGNINLYWSFMQKAAATTNQQVVKLAAQSRQSVFETFSDLKWGDKSGDLITVKEDGSFERRKQHLYGTSVMQITPVSVSRPTFQVEEEDYSSEEPLALLEEEAAMKEAFLSALQTIKGLKPMMPEDFDSSSPEVEEIKSDTESEFNKTNIAPEAIANPFNACIAELSGSNDKFESVYECFEIFLVLGSKSNHIDEFAQLFGAKEGNKIIFQNYRFSVTLCIVNDINDTGPQRTILWGIDETKTENTICVSDELYPILKIHAGKDWGLFKSITFIDARAFALLLQWIH